MAFFQKLSTNDIEEGLIRISQDKLAFFLGNKKRSDTFTIQVALPDKTIYPSSIAYFANSGTPRFLKELRIPLRRFFQQVGALKDDKLFIEKISDGNFALQFFSNDALRGAESIEGISSSITLTKKKIDDSFTQEEIEGTSFDAEEIDSKLVGFEGEDRDVIAKRRVNQGKFRLALLRYWDGRCGVSEVAHAKLLIASHIVPWSKANSSEKGDPANGLLLSVLWDALFDGGLVSFRDDGRAILDKLDKSLLVCLGIDGSKAAVVTGKLTPRHCEYLNRHRELHGFNKLRSVSNGGLAA